MVKDYVNVNERLGGKVARRSRVMLVTRRVTVAALVYGGIWLIMALGELLK